MFLISDFCCDAPEKILLAKASPCKPYLIDRRIWLRDVLLSFELIEKPYECYHVIQPLAKLASPPHALAKKISPCRARLQSPVTK